MSLRKLESLLQKNILDRETKLQIIDLILHAKNESSINELIDHLSTWKQADDELVRQLVEQIADLRRNYREQQTRIGESNRHTALTLADELASEQKIALIRNRILTLL